MSLITVVLGAGISEVIQLDDPCMTWDDRKLTCKDKGKRHIEITGDAAQLRSVLDACDNRANGGGWDQPLWYAGSAKAAARRIRAALTSHGDTNP